MSSDDSSYIVNDNNNNAAYGITGTAVVGGLGIVLLILMTMSTLIGQYMRQLDNQTRSAIAFYQRFAAWIEWQELEKQEERKGAPGEKGPDGQPGFQGVDGTSDTMVVSPTVTGSFAWTEPAVASAFNITRVGNQVTLTWEGVDDPGNVSNTWSTVGAQWNQAVYGPETDIQGPIVLSTTVPATQTYAINVDIAANVSITIGATNPNEISSIVGGSLTWTFDGP